MKEKINKFFYKGYHILCFVWFEVILAVIALINSIINETWQHVLIVGLLYLPWILLLVREFHYHKMLIRTSEIIKRKDLIRSIAEGFLYELNRYKKLYGELPQEETKEEIKEE